MRGIVQPFYLLNVMRHKFITLLSAVAAAFAVYSTKADQTISTFDTDTDISSWYWETWSGPGSINFDPADDAGGDSNSGSMQLVANFAAKSDYQQSVFSIQTPSHPKVSAFSKVALDLKVDADSLPRDNGTDYGHFEIVLRLGSGWVWTSISFDALQIGNWTHIEGNIPTVDPANDSLSALTLKIGDGNFTGPVSVHVDNVKLVALPAPVTVVDRFDTDAEVTPWYWENWSQAGTVEFDPANDAGGGAAGSGSMKLTASFNAASGYQQSVFTTALNPPIDGVTYSKVALDVKVDAANSTPRTGQTDYGSFEIVLRNGPKWDWNSITTVHLTDSGWTHVEANLAPPDDAVHHLTLKLGQNGFGGPVVFNVDNIVLIENTNKTVTPPTLSLSKAKPGLNLIASQLAAQYQRQSVRTTDNQFSWVGQNQPVTYSVEFSKFPDSKTYPGFQAHIFLVPGDAAAPNADVDWSAANLIFIDIVGQADGTTVGNFRYKVNEAGGNTMIYGTGTLGSVSSSTPIGKWSLTFTSDTHAKLTAPDGKSVEVDMPAADAALFAGPLYAYFGVQPNQLVNIGQSAVISRIDITGTASPLSDTFSTDTLNTDVWTVAAADPRGMVQAGPNAAYWVNWTTPAAGFVLQSTSSLTSPNWKDSTVAATAIASHMATLLNKSDLPAPATGFFRLIKR